jgi:diaminopimelate decarboxylase
MTGLSRLLPADFDVQILKKESVRRDHPYTICGPLCSPLDMLNREVWLPNCEPGDHLVISNVGAYGATASLTNFLSHPPPEEVSFMGDRFVNRFQLGFGHGAIYE